MEGLTVTVKQLNTYVKTLIESDVRLSYIFVSGEVSNFKNHFSSGHWYFSLKDNDAQIRCVMFRSQNARVHFPVCDGMKVILGGRVSLYERDGQYQFYAEEIRPEGEGDLAAAFNLLKEKLEKEGLFAPEHKRPIKKFPQKIAVLTSDTGAAVKDILNITSIRYPICEILLCPVVVQGENAVKSMTDMLDRVFARDDVDTIIIGRGGGSIEDLWAFNSEVLARKIYDSPIPVISAVGHETDFTICDFVSDVRASTPSHAAELAVPDGSAIAGLISTYTTRMTALVNSKYNIMQMRLSAVCSKPPLSSPMKFFDDLSLKADNAADKAVYAMKTVLLKYEKRLSDVVSRIDAMSPLKLISRGYAVVSSQGMRIKSIAELSPGQTVNVGFSDGAAECSVLGILSKE